LCINTKGDYKTYMGKNGVYGGKDKGKVVNGGVEV
jgi:hypothetical protein